MPCTPLNPCTQTRAGSKALALEPPSTRPSRRPRRELMLPRKSKNKLRPRRSSMLLRKKKLIKRGKPRTMQLLMELRATRRSRRAQRPRLQRENLLLRLAKRHSCRRDLRVVLATSLPLTITRFQSTVILSTWTR